MKEKGLLLPVSSLPNNYGVGDFGESAFKLIDLLSEKNFSLWQILPLNPLGLANSPYQPYSSFAIDEIYISLDILKEKKLIKKINSQKINSQKASFDETRIYKTTYFREAFLKFYRKNKFKLKNLIKNHTELYQYATFKALKDQNNNKIWNKWENTDTKKISKKIYYYFFLQLEALDQWKNIKEYANQRNVKIIGDIPFYVGYDSSDVYFNQKYFKLDSNCLPTKVAGVSPDYFSELGQRWGNPIYNFELLKENNYDFLIKRINYTKNLYDFIRLDHFRAFDTYYEIPYECEDATIGEWLLGPSYDFFNTLLKDNNINIIAEDLGDLRKEVFELRDFYKFPGMFVMQFYFFEAYVDNKFPKPQTNSITYIGTHDNSTLVSYLDNLNSNEKNTLISFLKENNYLLDNIYDSYIKMSLNSNSNIVILTSQDILHEDDSFRINIPGTINENNWSYRLCSIEKLKEALKNKIYE